MRDFWGKYAGFLGRGKIRCILGLRKMRGFWRGENTSDFWGGGNTHYMEKNRLKIHTISGSKIVALTENDTGILIEEEHFDSNKDYLLRITPNFRT